MKERQELRTLQSIAVAFALIALLGSPVSAQEASPAPSEPAEDGTSSPPIADPAALPGEAPAASRSDLAGTAGEEDASAGEDQYDGSAAPPSNEEAPPHPAGPAPPAEVAPSPLEPPGEVVGCEQYGCEQYDEPAVTPPAEDIPDPPLTEEPPPGAPPADSSRPADNGSCDQYAACDQYGGPLPSPEGPTDPCAVNDCYEFVPPGYDECERVFDASYGQYVYECYSGDLSPDYECERYFDPDSGRYVTECTPSSCYEYAVFDENGNLLDASGGACGAYAVSEQAADDSVDTLHAMEEHRSSEHSFQAGDGSPSPEQSSPGWTSADLDKYLAGNENLPSAVSPETPIAGRIEHAAQEGAVTSERSADRNGGAKIDASDPGKTALETETPTPQQAVLLPTPDAPALRLSNEEGEGGTYGVGLRAATDETGPPKAPARLAMVLPGGIDAYRFGRELEEQEASPGGGGSVRLAAETPVARAAPISDPPVPGVEDTPPARDAPPWAIGVAVLVSAGGLSLVRRRMR